MINAKIKNGKLSIPIKLIGEKEMTSNFYLDTGFNGYLKIDKKLFDELGLHCVTKKNVQLANTITDSADISRVKYKIDNAEGESEVMAVGWGGPNLIGTKFLDDAKIILIIDGLNGIHLTTDRKLAYEVGKTIYLYHNKKPIA